MYDLKTGTYSAGIPCVDEHSWLLEYIGKCQRKEILAGHELMQEFDILLDNFDNPDIKIDFADAHKRIKFIEHECKFSEAPFAGKPFILQLFQKAFIEAIYCFKIYDNEIGRYVRLIQDVLFVVGRKNGKTPLIGAINLSEWFCGEMGTKILCSSNDYEEAGLMFDAINCMRMDSPHIAKVTRANIKGMFFGDVKKTRKHGKFSWQNHGSIKKISAKTGAKEGRNIKVGAVDEVHEMKDNGMTMPIRQALSTQDEPLYFELTTEGFVNGGYLDDRLKEAREVLNGEKSNPRWLIWLYTQDSETEVWQDEKSWVKSNPGLGPIKKWSFIRGMVEEAKTNMQTRAFVLAKDFNIKQNSSSAAFAPEVYINEATFDPLKFAGCYAIGGVDLAESIDLLNARIMIMRARDEKGNPDPHKYMLSMYFIPEAKLDVHDDGKDYREWVKDGLITVSPGNDNDFSLVTKWFVDTISRYHLRPYKIGYDNALATYWKKEMSETFDDVDQEVMERIPQKHETLSNPFNLLGADLKSKFINYNYNPIDKWCLGNVAIDPNKRGLIMPCKMKPDKKIDGVATMVDCEYIYQVYKTEYMQYVNS